MSTGQTRTYPFWQKEKTAWCLPALCTIAVCTFFFFINSRPPSPCFRLKTLSISRQPTLRTAWCYRRTFPTSISRMTVFNAIWKILSERLDDGMVLNCLRLLWGGWLISTLRFFVLIVSSCISRNRVCYERNRSLPWAQGRRGHILSGKRKRPPDVCLYSIFYCSSAFSLWYQLPTAHPWFFPLCYTLWDFVVAFLTAKLLSVIDDFPLCKVREAWWIRKYRRLFREQVYEWTSCRNSLPFHQLTSLILGTKKSL